MAAPMGNMLTNIFQLFSVDNSGTLSLNDFLDSLNHNQMIFVKKDDDCSDLISHIHQCLNTSKNRQEGLVLLDCVVRQCSTSVFQKNSVTWLKLLLNILHGHHQSVSVYSACCHLLGNIIQHAKSFADISREIVSNVIPQLLPLLISAPAESNKAALWCINNCIRSYPGPVGPFKQKLITLVVDLVDNSLDSQELYECFALLPQCGPGGSMGIKHTEAWSELCGSTLASLHDTISCVYADLEIDSFQCSGQPLNLSPILEDQPDRITALVSRWESLTRCLSQLLSCEFPAVAKVPVEDVVTVVCRCLSINTNMLMSRATSARCLLAGFIQDLHVKALDLLTALITTCKGNMMVQGGVVVDVLTQELTWTHTNTSGHTQHYGYLRSKVYTVMSTWLKVMDGSSNIAAGEATLVKELIHDCLPYTVTLKLQSGSHHGDGGGKKGKKKKAGYQELSEGISSQRKSHPHANSELVTAALDALYWLMMTSGHDLSKKSAQSIHEFVIRTLVNIQQVHTLAVPYGSPSCRKGLYQLLQACTLTTLPGLPSPLQCALGLFSSGRLDKNLEVSATCLAALRVCETLIHPQAPCLNGPIICENVITINADPRPDNACAMNSNNKNRNRNSNSKTGMDSPDSDTEPSNVANSENDGHQMKSKQYRISNSGDNIANEVVGNDSDDSMDVEDAATEGLGAGDRVRKGAKGRKEPQGVKSTGKGIRNGKDGKSLVGPGDKSVEAGKRKRSLDRSLDREEGDNDENDQRKKRSNKKKNADDSIYVSSGEDGDAADVVAVDDDEDSNNDSQSEKEAKLVKKIDDMEKKIEIAKAQLRQLESQEYRKTGKKDGKGEGSVRPVVANTSKAGAEEGEAGDGVVVVGDSSDEEDGHANNPGEMIMEGPGGDDGGNVMEKMGEHKDVQNMMMSFVDAGPDSD